MTKASFIHQPDPDNPGWMTWELSDPTRFNSLLGRMMVRLEPDGQARVRMFPQHVHSNLSNNLHGGTILAFIDVALFAGSRLFGLIEAGTAVTLDLSVQFIGAGRVGEPMDAVVEVLRETGRLLFLRGLVVQGDHKVAGFSGTIRKPTSKPDAE
ncbi:PaaI family thioesterase [Sphingomonas colocasiae]|uniref:PaaI family thioesterase n=1 Tax=Sphingomonas colocasiae TaxID=1848973 RepID=A0ABS7PME0_9SPHN|nr:PaaI family thioesterase [Sphingomonas colocasiae]MBY8822474.1 PaaI family thioesterase [Sphingomonas colocasiae]